MSTPKQDLEASEQAMSRVMAQGQEPSYHDGVPQRVYDPNSLLLPSITSLRLSEPDTLAQGVSTPSVQSAVTVDGIGRSEGIGSSHFNRTGSSVQPERGFRMRPRISVLESSTPRRPTEIERLKTQVRQLTEALEAKSNEIESLTAERDQIKPNKEYDMLLNSFGLIKTRLDRYFEAIRGHVPPPSTMRSRMNWLVRSIEPS